MWFMVEDPCSHGSALIGIASMNSHYNKHSESSLEVVLKNND